MDTKSAAPTRTLRLVALVSGCLFWLLFVMWIGLIVIWLTFYYFFLPRINEYRPWLEKTISQQIGSEVRLGSLQVIKNGLLPHLEINNFQLFDAQGKSALTLPQVTATISPRSAIDLKLEQLYITNPNLYLKRDKEGQFWIAGIKVSPQSHSDSSIANWIFSQRHIQIHSGTLHWQDDLRNAPEVTLDNVNLSLNNGLFKHNFHLDVTPPSSWGKTVSLNGKFHQPLLQEAGDWQKWSGTLYLSAPQLDPTLLQAYLPPLRYQWQSGITQLQSWFTVANGTWKDVAVNLVARNVSVQADPQLAPLQFNWIKGEISAKNTVNAISYETKNLQFALPDNIIWPGGNVKLTLPNSNAPNNTNLTLNGSNLDLSALANIAAKLPLPSKLAQILQEATPSGQVQTIHASWNPKQPDQFSAQGTISNFIIQSITNLTGQSFSLPGFKNANINFNLNQLGGRAEVQIKRGAVDLPGQFNNPNIAFDSLAGNFWWKNDAKQLTVSGNDIKINNPDIKNAAIHFLWTKAKDNPQKSSTIQLEASVGEANLRYLYRYLPLAMDKEGRDYLQDLFIKATAENTTIKLNGNLQKFPFNTAQEGTFQIQGRVKNGQLRFAPNVTSSATGHSLAWPVISVVSADVNLAEGNLTISNLTGTPTDWPDIKIKPSTITIHHLYQHDTSVIVNLQAAGSLASMLQLVHQSPLDDSTGQALSSARGQGNATYTANFSVPIHQPQNSTIDCAITLNNSDFQFTPTTPWVKNLYGQIKFTDQYLSTHQLRGKTLGGNVNIEGGVVYSNKAPKNVARTLLFSGKVTAEGLQNANQLGPLSHLAKMMTGTTDYQVKIKLDDLLPHIQIKSNLVGLGFDLPDPLAKPSATALPLEVNINQSKITRGKSAGITQNETQVKLGNTLLLKFLQDTLPSHDKTPIRGIIWLNDANNQMLMMPLLPASGIIVYGKMDKLNINSWLTTLSHLNDSEAAVQSPTSTSQQSSFDYLPTQFFFTVKNLNIAGYTLSNFRIEGSRLANLWRANLHSKEANGSIQYKQGESKQTSAVFARLSDLSLNSGSTSKIDSALSNPPDHLPAMDIEVNQFHLRGKNLGKLHLKAVNFKSDGSVIWELKNLTFTTPEATMKTSGTWTSKATDPSLKQRTKLSFALDIHDGRALLDRFGMNNLIKGGHGNVKGVASWQGSPLDFNYPSLEGAFNINVESGQFLKADPGAAKLLGILSLQALPKRLTLNFSDVFDKGFSFDFFRGDVAVNNGVASTSNLQMKGVNAVVMMEGKSDLAKETQSIKVLIIPELGTGTAALITAMINPVIGLSTFLAQYFLSQTLSKIARQELSITGTWTDPIITKIENTP